MLYIVFMPINPTKKELLRKALYTKRRLVILNEDTFEEIFSLKLNLMNVFLVLMISTIVLISITTYVIAFTPLREYIPGYSSTELQKQANELAEKTMLLEEELTKNQRYVESIKKVLIGDLEYAKFNKDSILAVQMEDAAKLTFHISAEDSLLRQMVAQEDKYNLFEKVQPRVNVVLFSPARGKIIKSFSQKDKHLAVNIALPNNAPIKSVANGTVIFAEWTPNFGHVIIIRHNDGILSVYKNVASLTKSQSDNVRTGEVVGISGSNNKDAVSLPLHFELWKDGYPIDPAQFIDFEY